MRHIRVEISARDLQDVLDKVDAEQQIYLKLAEKGIPMDAAALIRRKLNVARGRLSWAYFTIAEKWVFDWTDEVAS